MEEEKTRRKNIITIAIGVFIMLVLVIGSTYAFFQITGSTEGSTSTNFQADLDAINKYGIPVLTKKSDLYIYLSASDMAISKGGRSYWATVKTEPQDIKYEEDRKNHIISTASIQRPEGEDAVEDGYLNCTSELTIKLSGEMIDYLTKGDGNLYLGINAPAGNKGSIEPASFDLFDLKSEQGSEGKKVTVNYSIKGFTSVNVTADIEIINKADTKQNDLSGKDIQIDITNANLSCSVGEKTITPLELVASEPQYLSQDPVGGMHRYQGLYTDDIKNYICLGDNCCTTESCPANSNDDMYRIIGITQSGEMKVIKKTALTDAVKWWSDKTTDIKWPQSLIYQKLNGKSEESTEPNYNDPNSYYYSLDDNLKSKIVNEHNWLYGDTTINGNYNGDTIYGIESGSSKATYYQEGDSSGSPTGKGEWSDTIDAPIGLMYLSDYYYAYKTSDNDAGKPGNYQNAGNSWIHLSHNETTYPSGSSGYEWTMSRYGLNPDFGSYRAWNVNVSGSLNGDGLDVGGAVRPSFYLASDVELSGEGSLTEPFRITSLEE